MAGLVTLVLSVAMILDPIDQFGWLIQSNLANRDPSGEIVYVGVDQDIADPLHPQRRRELARLITRLERAGADKLFFNLRIEQPAEDPGADRQLNAALREFGDRATVTVRNATDFVGDSEAYPSVKTITNGLRSAVAQEDYSYLGFTWSMQYTSLVEGRLLPSLPVAMAEADVLPNGSFPVSYIFDIDQIGSYRSTELMQKSNEYLSRSFAGKTVLLGPSWGSDEQTAKIPGYQNVASSFVAILAAETLRADLFVSVGPWVGFGATFLLLILVVGISMNESHRHLGYVAISVVLLGLFLVGTALGARISVGSSVLILMIYAAARLRVKWQQKFALVDQLTKLPTFRALLRDLSETKKRLPLIVAEIHGFQAVLQALPPTRHKDYILRLVDRLALAEDQKVIYANDSRHFAWLSTDTEVDAIREHLEGLRSLFSQPLVLDGTKIDVGITFGVEVSEHPSPSVRIATAMNAVEKTSEAHEFIVFDGADIRPTDMWELSLRARIDAALEREEIFVVYQPQIDLAEGRIIGLEALVRWDDPEKGAISPAYFVEQCEKAGRMDHLTRHVLDRAVADLAQLTTIGIDIRMSVNISATLLSGNAVIDMVQNAVDKHEVKANRVCLEITETAKIPNMDRALLILERLSSQGFRLALDDFGVGEANVENLYRLPFDEMKIDKLFTRDLATQKNRAILQSLVALGREAGMEVIAEGIESRQTLQFLKQIGCSLGQGYYLSYPLHLRQVVEYIDHAKMANDNHS
ncbi:EAL domain-containing protein [Pseudopontixanthobacter vadosimaris]|uniref:EAL domain-containing protein n=1 Tax=Pseudopontixanthobacter vadosimaris TaxID=2726450 RepID=UPI0030B919AD